MASLETGTIQHVLQMPNAVFSTDVGSIPEAKSRVVKNLDPDRTSR